MGQAKASDQVERSDDADWYVLKFKENMRGLVVMQLVARGVEFYAPMYRRARRIAGVRSVVAWPIFKGYMFIRHPDGVLMRAGGIVGSDTIYDRAVPPAQIRRFREKERDGLIDLQPPQTTGERALKVGDTVHTLDGWIELVVTELVDENRVRLLSAILRDDKSARPIVADVSSVRIAKRANDNEASAKRVGKRKRKGGKR